MPGQNDRMNTRRRTAEAVAVFALAYAAWRILGYPDVPFNQNEILILLCVSALIVFLVGYLIARRK